MVDAGTIHEIMQQIGSQTKNLVQDATFAADGQRVLIASGRYDKIGTPIEVLVGLALAQRGVDVQFLLCDQAMPVCDVRRSDRDTAATCADCWNGSQYLIGATRLPFVPFQRWLTRNDLDEIRAEISRLDDEASLSYRRDGVQLGHIAYASTLRYFLRSSLSNEAHQAKFREFLVTAALMLRLSKRVMDDLKPDAIFISHGIYVTWGVLTDYAAAQGIRVVVYGYGYRKGTILLSIGGSYHRTLTTEDARTWLEKTLSDQQEQRIRRYLASRANGGLDWISYNSAATHTPEQLREKYGLQPDKPIYALFTNIAWDAAVVFHHSVFPSMEAWLIETIRWAIERSDMQLLIRCHPAEVRTLSNTQETAYDIIRTVFPTLPDHIRVIGTDADVNTYDLTELADVVLVYTTKVGLEFATRDIPVIVAGEAFYRGKGFTYDPTTVDEYFSLLSDVARKPIPKQSDLALRYAYYYFFRRYIKLSGLQDGGIGQPVRSIDINHLSQLDEGADTDMDTVCDAILYGAMPIAPKT